MKSRFFGNQLGYVVVVIWPFVHIAILLIIFGSTGRIVPNGDSSILYIATGAVPFISFNYISRFIMYGAVQNKAFTQYPIVKLLDIFVARAYLEIIAQLLVAFLLVISLVLLGINAEPVSTIDAAIALISALCLGAGMGVLNGVIAMVYPPWLMGYTLIVIGSYAASGILFIPSHIPEPFRTALSFNPVLQNVEWMRAAYYANYGSVVLSRTYALSFGLISLALGIILERIVRNKT